MHSPPSNGGELSSLERAFQTFKRGVLGLLFVMANDTAKPEKPRTTWFLTLLQMLQVRGGRVTVRLLWPGCLCAARARLVVPRDLCSAVPGAGSFTASPRSLRPTM